MAKRNLPTAPLVPLELWRALYLAASEFQLLAPWRWMDDTHVLGLDSALGVRLVSVMGNLGEVFGLVSYRGTAGTNFLLRLLRGEFAPETTEAIYHQDAVLVDFVPRKELRKPERPILQQIDFQPVASRPTRLPQFSSHKPGYLPWFIDEAEARMLLEDLPKATRFAQLLQANPRLFASRGKDEFPFYPPSPQEPLTPDQLQWHRLAPSALSPDPPVDFPPAELEAMLQIPQDPASIWELAAAYSRSSISEPPRPYFSKLALSVDAQTGLVEAFHLGGPDVSMAQTAAECLMKAIAVTDQRPASIKLASLNLSRALGPLAEALGVRLVQAKALPMADEALRSLHAYERGV